MKDRLKALRKALGLRQIDLATAIGASNGNVGDWERGKVKPGADALAAIVKVFPVSAQWLLTGEGELMANDKSPRQPPWKLNDHQKKVAAREFENLVEEQVALINAFEKLDAEEKEEIWMIIDHKLGKKQSLSSHFQTSKDEESGSSKTA